MSIKNDNLTEEERNILVMVAQHPGSKHLTNDEISQRLGISINRVKAGIHHACQKIGANNRDEVVYYAMTQGKIKLSEVLSLEELTDILSSADPYGMRMIAESIRRGQVLQFSLEDFYTLFQRNQKQNGILTNRERDVLILAGRGLNNREIANRLCLTTDAIRTFLNRAFIKLGARKRADAVQAALKSREISASEISTPEECFNFLSPLGAETIEEIAQRLEKKYELESKPSDHQPFIPEQPKSNPDQYTGDELIRLTDEQWSILQTLIPDEYIHSCNRSQSCNTHRDILDGILWMLRRGTTWENIPDQYPSMATCDYYFQKWKCKGILEQILIRLADDLKYRGHLDLTELFIVGTYVLSKRNGKNGDKKHQTRGSQSWQWQTALIFLSPYTRKLLYQMQSPLWEQLSHLDG